MKGKSTKNGINGYDITLTEDATLRSDLANAQAALKGTTCFHSDEAVNAEMGRLRAEMAEVKRDLAEAKEEEQKTRVYWSSAYYRMEEKEATAHAAGMAEMLATVKRLMNEADMKHREYDETWEYFEQSIKDLLTSPVQDGAERKVKGQ